MRSDLKTTGEHRSNFTRSTRRKQLRNKSVRIFLYLSLCPPPPPPPHFFSVWFHPFFFFVFCFIIFILSLFLFVCLFSFSFFFFVSVNSVSFYLLGGGVVFRVLSCLFLEWGVGGGGVAYLIPLVLTHPSQQNSCDKPDRL